MAVSSTDAAVIGVMGGSAAAARGRRALGRLVSMRLILVCSGSVLLLSLPAASPEAFAASVDHSKRCGARGGPPPFQSYWLGQGFDGMELRWRNYDCAPAYLDRETEQPMRHNTEGFLYEDCDPAPCQIALNIQVYPACDRTFASYDFDAHVFARPPPDRLRGVPAAIFGDGTRIELYTGDVTVVLFGYGDPQRTRRAALALASTPQSPFRVAAGDPLPPAVPGHTTQTLYCGLKRFRVRAVGRTARARTCFNGGRCRHQRLRLTLTEPAMIWGEARRAGDRAGSGPFPASLTQFGFRASRGTRTYRIDVRGRGRHIASMRGMTRDGRRSRPVRLAFTAR